MSTLTETINAMMTPELFRSLAVRSGVSETKVRTGMTAATGAIMEGLARHAHNPSVMDDTVQLIDRTPEVSDPLAAIDEDDRIRSAGNQMLGLATNDTSGVTKRLASSLGVGSGVASSLLTAAASIILNGLRRFSRARGGLDATALSSTLLAEAPGFFAAMPGPVPSSWRERERAHHRPLARTHERRWLWLLALIPLILIGAWLFNRHERLERRKAEPMGKVTEPERMQSEKRAITPPAPDPKSVVPEEPAPMAERQTMPDEASGPQDQTPLNDQQAQAPQALQDEDQPKQDQQATGTQDGGLQEQQPKQDQNQQATGPQATNDGGMQTQEQQATGPQATNDGGQETQEQQTGPQAMPAEPNQNQDQDQGEQQPKQDQDQGAQPQQQQPNQDQDQGTQPKQDQDQGAQQQPQQPPVAIGPGTEPEPGQQPPVSVEPGTPPTHQPVNPGTPAGEEPAQPSQPPAGAQPEAPSGATEPKTAETAPALPEGSAEAKIQEQVSSVNPPEEPVTLDEVKFDSGNAAIKAGADAQLSRVAEIMDANPDVRIEINGYTDGTGSSAQNMKLSQKRADATRDALMKRGIDGSRIQAKGKGDQNPAEETPSGSEANRRVTVLVVSR